MAVVSTASLAAATGDCGTDVGARGCDHRGGAFLTLLDQQSYVDAWRDGTRYFQSRLSVGKWQQILKSYREPLGRVRARRLTGVRHLGRFETAPSGTYMQVDYLSTFGRYERNERLVIRKDADGRWRIAGYQLR